VLNKTIVRTAPNNVSKYKEVRYSGYKDPVKNGYPKFAEKQKIAMGSTGSSKTGLGKEFIDKSKQNAANDNVVLPKKYLYGDGSVTKTDRGYETKGGSVSGYEKKRDAGYTGGTNTYGKEKSNNDGGYSAYRKNKPGTSGSTYSPAPKSQSGNNSTPSYRKQGSGSTSGPKKKGSSVTPPSKPKSSDDGDKPAQAKPGAVQKEAPKVKSDGKVSQPPQKSGGDSGPKKGPGHSGKKKGD
jgi:hypothetical protein